jgi:hypothetical protein
MDAALKLRRNRVLLFSRQLAGLAHGTLLPMVHLSLAEIPEILPTLLDPKLQRLQEIATLLCPIQLL